MSKSARHRRIAAGVSRNLLAGLAVLAGLSGCAVGQSGAAEPAKPSRLQPLPDGRHINLRCTGRGGPTVLLESGFGAGVNAWVKVQPVLARSGRVCAYDRAGYGFSDVGPLPRDGVAIARDLDFALRGAREAGPFVVVGHSAGGLYARLFAARRQSDVVGLVLVDPTLEQRRLAPGQDGLGGIRARVQRCLAGADAPDARCERELGRPGDKTAAARRLAWESRFSELDEIYGRTSEQVARVGPVIADIPTYVLTASATADAAPRVLFPEARSALELQHEVLAAKFRNGSRRTVFSSHLIMIDRPDTVIDAVEAMIGAHRAGQTPPPLPPSEQEVPQIQDPVPEFKLPSTADEGQPTPLPNLR